MLLTQEEAEKWGKILLGFSQGKQYQIPYSFDEEGNVTEYIKITDFEVNPQCPTITMTYSRGVGLIPPGSIKEVL